MADTYWDSCATWWKLGYLEKFRFHFWSLAIHMKMSIKFSPSKVLIKKFMGRAFLIRYLLTCIFLLLRDFFIQFDLDSVIGLTAMRQWLLISLWMGLRHASRQDNTVLNQIDKKHYVYYMYSIYMSMLWETVQVYTLLINTYIYWIECIISRNG